MAGRFLVFFFALALCVNCLSAKSHRSFSGYALHFDGGQALIAPDCPALRITGDLTIEAWIRPDLGIRDVPFDFIVSNHYGPVGYTLLLAGMGDWNRIQFEAKSPVAYEIGEPVMRGQWWHVAGVLHDGTERIYLNGVMVAEAKQIGPLTASGFPLRIGSSLWTGFHGDIDEVRIWNIARTQDEIAYWRTRWLTGKENGLAGYWPMNEGRGQISKDKTGHDSPALLGTSTRREPSDPKWIAGVLLTR